MIRHARNDDYEAFTKLFPELRIDDPMPSREKWIAELVPTTFVAEHAGEVIGYAWYQSFTDEGIVRNLVVAPRMQGHGVGRALMLEVARALQGLGLGRWALNVKPDNAPALALYGKLGFAQTFRSLVLRFGWPLVDTLPNRADLAVVQLEPEEDARAEVDQRLPRGSLARHRSMVGRRVLGVAEGARITGVAVFVPALPGAHPFRADDLAVARGLLEGLRPAVSAPVVNVVLEGQPALAEGLVRLGAVVRHEIAHLEGALPCEVASPG
jgi:GNAT superfamily N-acetyltransferase